MEEKDEQGRGMREKSRLFRELSDKLFYLADRMNYYSELIDEDFPEKRALLKEIKEISRDYEIRSRECREKYNLDTSSLDEEYKKVLVPQLERLLK